MKKLLILLLSAMLVLSLSACGKSEAAKAVDDQISAIGQVTLDSEPQIAAAEEAVAALSEEDRKQLDNTGTLEKARTDYEALVLASEAAKVDEAIGAIGTVTLDSGDAIKAARSLYDGSSPEVQAQVAALSQLEDAEAKLSDLRVEQVTGLINEIGTVTLESAAKIQTAQDVMDALPAEEAAKVSNASVLTAAAEQLKTLKKEQAQSLLSGMRVEGDKVRGMSFYYPKAWKFYSNGSWAADIRCFVLPYLGQDANSTWLRLVYNYTDDDWVFFKKITVAADDQRFYKSFNYFDIVHDNGGGDVWEYIDTDVSDADIEMLWAIANATETIIRFEGDDYYSDFTVKDTDKQAIREVLTAYDALR